MANNTKEKELQKRRQERARKRELFNEECNRTRLYHIAGIVLCVAMLLLLFVNFAEVYNTESGVEVKVSGWSFFVAGITQKFDSVKTIYGDLAVPFYYYAASWCKGVAIVTAIAVFIAVFAIGLEVVIIVRRMHSLTFISALLGFISAVLLLVAFILSLGMKNGKILSIYCSGNTACSIRSYAVWPFIVMLLYTACDVFIGVKLLLAHRILN